MDAGIIRATKAHYRRRIVNKWVDDVETQGKITRLDILQAIRYFADAWNNDLEPRTIAHGFRKTGLFPIMRSAEINEITEPGSLTKSMLTVFDDLASKIDKLTLGVPGFKPLLAEDYVDIDAREDTEEVKTELDIVAEVVRATGMKQMVGTKIASVGVDEVEKDGSAGSSQSRDREVSGEGGVEDELCERLQVASISHQTGPPVRQRKVLNVIASDKWRSYY